MLFFLILLAPSSLPLSQTNYAEQSGGLLSQCGKQAATDHTIPSCPYTTLVVHLARSIWVPTKAVPSHRRPLQWFLWVGTADKHSIHHHSHAHQSPLCLPRHASKLFNRQWPESQRSLLESRLTEYNLTRALHILSAFLLEHFSSFSCYYLVIIEQWVTLILSWTSDTVFVCICISLSIFFLTRGDVMSPLRHSRMIASHSKVPVSTRARGCE